MVKGVIMKSLLDRGIELKEYQRHMLNGDVTSQYPRRSGKTFISFIKAMNYVERCNSSTTTIHRNSYLIHYDPDVRTNVDAGHWISQFTLFVNQYYPEYTITRSMYSITLSRLTIWET